MTNQHWMDVSPAWILPYEEAFLESLARTLREGAKIVNIGSGAGTSASALLRGIYTLRHAEVLSIDIDETNQERNTLREQGLYDQAKIHQLVGDSVEIGKSLGIELDMVFVDGSHDYKGVLDDLNTYSKLLKPGGLLVCHDYHDPRQENVTKAIEKWLSYKKNADWIKIGHVLYTLALMKPSEDMLWANGRV